MGYLFIYTCMAILCKGNCKIKFYKKNKWHKKKRILSFFIVLFFIVVFVIVYISRIVNPIIISMGEAKVKSLATKAINMAVSEVLCEGDTYDDIIDIKFTDSGEISYMQAKSLIVNRLSRDLVSTSQSKLDIIGEQGISIPIGSLSGVPLFMGRGPEVRLKLFPVGAISCQFKSVFSQAGINQTNHKIYVNINSNVTVVMPISSRQVNTTTQLLICESVIVGKVPETFLHYYNLDEMMNLIP